MHHQESHLDSSAATSAAGSAALSPAEDPCAVPNRAIGEAHASQSTDANCPHGRQP
jgi:hypothetical protein